MHLCFTKRVEPTNAYESVWIYYIEIVVNLLHVSVTFCGHLRFFFVARMYYKNKQTVSSLFDMAAFMVLWLLVVILILLGVSWFDLCS